MNDLTRRAALVGVAAIAASPVAAKAAIIASDGHPDAALFALDRQLDALLAEFDAFNAMPDDFDHPVWQKLIAENPGEPDIQAWLLSEIQDRYHALVDTIMAGQPRTVAGLAVMARTARLDWECSGFLEYGGEPEISAELCRAVLELCGAAPRAYEWT